jgi:hypothetical protein
MAVKLGRSHCGRIIGCVMFGNRILRKMTDIRGTRWLGSVKDYITVSLKDSAPGSYSQIWLRKLFKVADSREQFNRGSHVRTVLIYCIIYCTGFLFISVFLFSWNVRVRNKKNSRFAIDETPNVSANRPYGHPHKHAMIQTASPLHTFKALIYVLMILILSLGLPP